MEGRAIKGVNVQNRAGRKAILSRAVIDATGDLNIVAGAQAPFHYHKEGSATLLFELAGVDLQKTYEYYLTHPDEYREDISEAITFSDFIENSSKRGLFQNQHGGGRYISVVRQAIKEGRFAREKGISSFMDAERGHARIRKLLYCSNGQ